MGLMIVEMDARIAAGEDFDLGANANPYPRQSASWRFYEAEYQSLTDGEPVMVADEHPN
jgi:hypothetical protein